MQSDGKINYIEFPAGDLGQTKAFYEKAFGLAFTDYGPSYAAFGSAEAGIEGGFDADPAAVKAPLVLFHALDLEAALVRVEAAGGEVVQPIFSYPGGRRFHFKDPSGNVLGIYAVS